MRNPCPIVPLSPGAGVPRGNEGIGNLADLISSLGEDVSHLNELK